MMDNDNLYKYIGMIILAIFIIYIILRTLNFQATLIEGLTTADSTTNDTSKTDKDKIPDMINANTTIIEDGLLIDKYKKTYEDIIINLENNVNYFMLGGIMKNSETISKNPMSADSQKIINNLNNLKIFKDTLNDSMNFLDKSSSVNTSSLSSSGLSSSDAFSF
jgi:hypothetical protein